MTQKKTHQSKKANGVTKAATVRLANGLTGLNSLLSDKQRNAATYSGAGTAAYAFIFAALTMLGPAVSDNGKAHW